MPVAESVGGSADPREREASMAKEMAMKNKATWLAVIGLGVIGMTALGVWAENGYEEEVTLDQVPAAVKATILRESAEGKITEIERETKNGKVLYEAEFRLGSAEIEITIAPDGTVIGREVEGPEDDEDDLHINHVPEPARSALLDIADGAPIIGAERDREHGVVIYEADWLVDGIRHEAAVMADGTLIEVEEIIAVAQAPAAVQASIATHFGAGTDVIVAKKMIVVYEVEAKIDGKEKELYIFPTGRVHEDANEDDDDDDDDDDESNDD
jgi:hypothetical protein